MKQKKQQTKNARKKELTFYHKDNKSFKGFLIKETDDYYTIKLSSDVVGINGLWYSGETVTWSKERTRIVN